MKSEHEVMEIMTVAAYDIKRLSAEAAAGMQRLHDATVEFAKCMAEMRTEAVTQLRRIGKP